MSDHLAEPDSETSYVPLIVAVVSLIVLGVLWGFAQAEREIVAAEPSTENTTSGAVGSKPDDEPHRVSTLKLAFLITQVVVISIVIWQACDPFADAAQWIGKTFHIPGSVRGATLDAVASSMPELFTGVFFVLIPILVMGSSAQDLEAKTTEGFGAAIATCAGSAVYNMILIPAFCAIFISIYRPQRPTIDVESEVITRDGIWFLGCSVLLIVFLYSNVMYWWMGIAFLVLYAVYVGHLYVHARSHRRDVKAIKAKLGKTLERRSTVELVTELQGDGVAVTAELVERIRAGVEVDEDEDYNDNPDTAGVFFGLFEIGLNHFTSWLVIAVSTVIAAVSCYWLVTVTHQTAEELGVPLFFVAVILAAAASSVPDTFLSIGAAMRGDDSGAVSNAFGSNIFDICICLSVPLLINAWLLGWAPVPVLSAELQMEGLVDLRILLAALTVVTLMIMWHRRQLTRTKAVVLCLMYGLFLAYAVAGSYGFSFSKWLIDIVNGGA